ncbi:alpha/beta hydrolase [Asanoa sp. WMMD1127]|uniref:alpha/beta hydrolase n=1 Tax=Asanoa sp. WMMD1127 TaxID=3016107 RepID=UPI002416C623|nr:alpha/beta hydrolase [Asanoa sp. WMMD1127]MDG4826747.1 alpha/beta hydrolase [Asanoa sp. WMMD1127]
MMRRTLLLGGVAATLGAGLLMPASTPAAAAPAAGPTFTAAYPAAAAAMRAAGGAYAGWARSGRTFLAFDTRGDGTAVEVVGDLATADRIAVVVPGVDTTLATFTDGLGGVARRAPATQARELYAAAGGGSVAVIAWLGYDPPEGVGLEAAREVRARAGARNLAAFTGWLADRRPDAHITLIGHSYGAVVVGLAAPELPSQVTALVALGAPGMGADDVAGLHTRASVYAALAPTDWIHRIPQMRLLGLGLGTRPASADFGATALPTAGVEGHDHYFTPGTASLAAVAAVVTR